MKQVREIPSALIQQWEQEAIDQKLPYTEFGSFLKMKEQNYYQSLDKSKTAEKVFANDARNKLTEFGQRVALDTLLALPMVERVCKFARFDYEEMQEEISNGFKSEAQKVYFLDRREHWFLRLKAKMKELRISKETLESYGLSLKTATAFAYQTL